MVLRPCLYTTPQVGFSQQEKDQFYENLESEMRRIPLHEELIIGGDLNGHVGKDRSNLKENMEDTGTASKTQKEKASSALLRHIFWWWQTHTFKKNTST